MRLIDADALLNNIRRAVYPSDLATTIAVGICESRVKDMPTVEAEPVRHGRWVDRGFDFAHCEIDGWLYEWLCSECNVGRVVHSKYPEETKYCMICGAKMDGGDGNES